MITPFNLTRDINGYNGFGLPYTNTKYSATLATSTDTSLTVPTTGIMGGPVSTVNTYIAIFSYSPGAEVWVAYNQTAEVPAGASFAATASELNPVARKVSAGDVLHFITPDSTVAVGVIFYGIS